MGYITRPVYQFDDETSTGIDSIPLNELVLVESLNGSPTMFYYNNSTNVTETSTIGEIIGDQKRVLAGETIVSIDADHDARDGDSIFADATSGAITITLPANPAVGVRVRVYDAASSFTANNVTIARNGETIMGIDDDILLDVDDQSIELIYANSDWKVYNV